MAPAMPARQKFYCEKLDIMVSMCRLTTCTFYERCQKNHQKPVEIFPELTFDRPAG